MICPQQLTHAADAPDGLLHVADGDAAAEGAAVSAQQHIHRAVEDACQVREERGVRQRLAALPKADGLAGHIQPFGKFGLGEAGIGAAGADGRADGSEVKVHGAPPCVDENRIACAGGFVQRTALGSVVHIFKKNLQTGVDKYIGGRYNIYRRPI